MAFPDSGAGTDYYVVAYAPPRYSTQFAILALTDTRVTITYTGLATPSRTETQINLSAGQVYQVQVLPLTVLTITTTRIRQSNNQELSSRDFRVLVI